MEFKQLILGSLFIRLLAVIMLPQTAAKSWLIEGPKEGGKQICHTNICTCNRQIDGIPVFSSSSSLANETNECQTYNLQACTFMRDKRDVEKIRIATSAFENLPQHLETGFGYGLRVNRQYGPDGEDTYGVVPMDLQNQASEMLPSNVKHLSIDLCPKEHTIFNNTLSFFNKLRTLSIEGKGAVVKVNNSGFLSGMRILVSLRIINVQMEKVHLGEFCGLKSLDDITLTFLHPSVIQGFNCLNRSCDGPCLAELETANLTGNNISNIDFQLSLVFPKIQKLFLQQNDLTSVNDNVFGGLTKLHILDLSQNKLKVLDFRLFKGFSDLAVLSLSHNNLQVVDGTYFPNSIEEIYLQGNNISELIGRRSFLFRKKGEF